MKAFKLFNVCFPVSEIVLKRNVPSTHLSVLLYGNVIKLDSVF